MYSDDPMRPHSDHPTGSDIIDIALERHHTLLIGTDPDRLEVTLKHFLKRNVGRILWLHEGKILFEGNGDVFRRDREDIGDSISLPDDSHKASAQRFLQIVRSA